MKTIALTINGRRISCPAGSRLLDVAESNGIRIPHLCSHPDLKPVGACRLCLVEDEVSGRVMAACVTPAVQDMRVQTDSERIRRHRRNIVRLMMAEHPESCIVCSKGNRCQLRGVAAQLGIGETGLYPMPNYKPLEQSNAFIVRDLSKCILCGKCIRADHELVGAGAIDYHLRGFKSRPATVYDLPLEQSSCTFCGTCVSVCPTGALSTKRDYIGTPEKTVASVCGFCGVGCHLTLGIAGGQVVHVGPSNHPKSVNGATLCVRGHFAHDFLSAGDRLTTPLVRRNGEFEPIDWERAIEHVAGRLLDINAAHGPSSIAFLGSSKCTNEENYLFQKIARALVKTNNIDNGGYLFGRQILALIDRRTDPEGRFNFFAGPLKGLEKAEVIFILGADPCQSAPVLSYYLKRAAANGVPILLADPRPTELAPSVRLHLELTPGSDLALVNALSAILCRRNAADTSFVNRFTKGFQSYISSLEQVDLVAAGRMTGLGERALEAAADHLAGRKISFIVGNGVLAQFEGKNTVEALLNLAMMTGSIGYAGAGFYVTARENNLVGAWDMGAVPNLLPGRRRLGSDAAHKEWESVWESEIPTEPGLNLLQMIAAAANGSLKAMVVMGENPLRSLPDPEKVRQALTGLELLVVQDILQTETAAIADVVLPGASFAEKAGTFTNMEGRMQHLTRATPPPGNARSDFDILAALARKLENRDRLPTLADTRAEIARVLPMYAEPYLKSHLVWLKDAGPLLEPGPDKSAATLSFSPVCHTEPEQPADNYPYVAIFGSSRYHLGSGTRTGRSKRIQTFTVDDGMDVSVAIATALSLNNGDPVSVASPAGTIRRTIRVRNNLSGNRVFIPGGYSDNDARCLLPRMTTWTDGPRGWNCCRVNLTKTE